MVPKLPDELSGNVKTSDKQQGKDIKRQLSFSDVFFLSFGGQSPLLSLLTYGAVALSLGGYFAPVIILIGTAVVLVNGLVVNRLSKRFTSLGGYYTYAMNLLSERFGFQTGCTSILQSFSDQRTLLERPISLTTFSEYHQ